MEIFKDWLDGVAWWERVDFGFENRELRMEFKIGIGLCSRDCFGVGSWNGIW